MLPVKTVLGLCNTEKDQIHGRKVEKTSFCTRNIQPKAYTIWNWAAIW